MYNIKDFEPYEEGDPIKGEDVVLAWSRATGYHFIQFGFIPVGSQKIVARQIK